MNKHLLTGLAIIGLSTSIYAAETNTPAVKSSPFKNEMEKASYCIGLSIGNSWKHQGVEADPDIVAHGIKDVLSGNPQLVSDQEANETLMAYQQTLRAKVEEKRKQQIDVNKKAGDEFLAKNKSEAGVITLPDGLQYKVITEGKGESPKATDTVTVNYRGTLIDGTEFDSSYKRGEPATFPLSGVIKGWTEGVQLMKPGAKYKFFIPSGLAYGENAPPSIGPNAVLVFDIELISVAPVAQPITSDIIRVPSAEEIKHGAKPETIKADQLEQAVQKQAAEHKAASTN